MSDADRIEQLTAELRACEQETARIKAELAALLGIAQAESSVRQRPSAGRTTRRTRRETSGRGTKRSGPVAAGTKGREVIEAIEKSGGQASARDIARVLARGSEEPSAERVKQISSTLNNLSKAGHGYVRNKERGAWCLTAKGRAALAK